MIAVGERKEGIAEFFSRIDEGATEWISHMAQRGHKSIFCGTRLAFVSRFIPLFKGGHESKGMFIGENPIDL